MKRKALPLTSGQPTGRAVIPTGLQGTPKRKRKKPPFSLGIEKPRVLK